MPAAAVFFSLDASSGLLATASASAPALFSALRSLLLWCELYDMRERTRKEKKEEGLCCVLCGLVDEDSVRLV